MNENRRLKEQEVSKINSDIQNSKSMIVANYHNLTVADLQELRSRFEKNNFKLKVYKNRLVKIALENTDFKDLNSKLVGPNIFAFAQENELELVKILSNFSKTKTQLEFVGGIYDSQVQSKDDLIKIANLPSREEAMATLMMSLLFPLQFLSVGLNSVKQ